MLYICLLIAVFCAPAIYCILGRPRLVPDPVSDAAAEVSISIIIPARNEETNIALLLDSISMQSLAPAEVIVVNDGSTDLTAKVANERGARVVEAKKKPDDWNGKPWACHQGAGVSKSDWFLFLDADTRLLPGAMEKLTGLTSQKNRVFSLCPYHMIQRPYEQLSAFFNVIMVAGVNAFGLRSDPSKDAGLFGQVLLISKQHYRDVGGHGVVRNEILENFRMAHHLKEMGLGCECYLGKGTVVMRMFPSGFADLWASWKKGFTMGARDTAPRALLLISIWISGAMFTIVGMGLALTPLVSDQFRLSLIAVYFLYLLLCLWAFKLVGSYSFLNAVLFPVSLIFYQALFFTALVERKLGIKSQWKGRDVD